ncbi:MAG: DUF2029 domain-containing protein [Spirochaetes bacterium]|nr:DUF2029 domain-containing protein [Spirochaetota bacterium]
MTLNNLLGHNRLTQKDLIYLSVIVVFSLLLIFISIVLNFKFNVGEKNNSDFYYFFNESKKVVLNKNYYKENYDHTYLEIIDKNDIKPIYPPMIYYLYFLLSLLPVKISFIVYSVFNLLLYIFSINLIISYFKRLHKFRYLIILLSLLFPPFLFVLIAGNISVLWVFVLIASFYLAKKEKNFFSGIVLSLFVLKPSFFILIFIILFLSFKGRLFIGLMLGAFLIITTIFFFNGFTLWLDWFKIVTDAINKIFYQDTMYLIKQNTSKIYFYPMKLLPKFLITIEYIFTLTGLASILAPIIYTFNHNKDFSRNSFWFIFTLSFVLASPYLYNYELIILILPLIIFINLMLADRVVPRVIILIIIVFLVSLFLLYILSIFIYVQLLSIIFWFFLINGVLGKRVKNYMPKTYVQYWDDY